MQFKIGITPAAVALALASFAATTQAATVDFHGYARSGVGASTEGGSLVCFKNVGSMGAYRLGNECDTYMELAFDANLAEKGDSVFKLHTMIVAGTQQLNDWEQSAPAWRQVWAEATNVGAGPLSNASLWAGKRYYKRQNVDMLDFWYVEVAGPGAGIEGIDIGGVGKFSYAYMRTGGDLDYNDPPLNDFFPNYSAGGNKSMTNHDLRLEGIALGSYGSIDAILNIASPNNREDVKGKGGYAFTAQHTIGVLGGFNRIHASFAKDGSNLNHGTKWYADDTLKYEGFQVMDQMVFDSGPFNGSAVIGYQSDKNGDGPTAKQFTIGVRPWYHFNDLYSVGGELGHIEVKPGNGAETRKLDKLTVAAQITAGKSFWSRPAIRAYYTYAKWNDALKGSNVTCTGRDCNVKAQGFDDTTNGASYGMQFEAWW